MSSGNHRAYQPIKPAASRMLAKRWDDSSYGLHRKKLRNAKPTVDTRAPKTYMHLQLKLKKLQMEEERLATVERDNRILLEKMSHIMRTRGRVDNRNDYDHKSLNKTKRQQELLRITHENQAILKRITAKQPFYDRSAWAREYDKARQYQGQISRFPQGEETGASSSTSRATKGKRRGKRDTTPPPPRESILTKEDVVAAVAPGAAEQKALKMINDRAFLEDLWNQCDFNGNGGCSLAEIDKMVVERGWNLSKPTLLRAYKKTTLKDGDQDAWVERDEFAALIRNMFLFENLWSLFDDLDTEDDRRINEQEFHQGMVKLGLDLSADEAANEFAIADKNGGGQILFREFCDYIGSIIDLELEAVDAAWVDHRSKGARKKKGKAPAQKKASPKKTKKKYTQFDPEVVRKAVAPGAAEQKALKMINDRAFLEDLWNQCDFNGNGGCSLAEIDKMVVERGWNLSKPTLLRAYKKTTLKDGDQDAWVERDEFAALIRNMFLFENLWSLFDDLDTEDDRRVNFDEFRLGMAKIGSRMSEEDAKKEFAKADKNGGGQILFKEFCNYIASVLGFDIEADDAKWKDSSKKKKAGGKKSEHDTNADVSTEKFDELETKLMADLKAGKAGDFWKEIDFNNNKIVSLAEIDKWVVERYPLLNSKPALMRAYKKTLAKDGDDDDFVREEEFASLLRNIFYFNKLFVAFDGIDTDNDRRIDLSEFKRGLSHFGLSLSDDEAQKEFDAMDSNDGGVVLFDEFAAWAAAKKMPVD